MKTRHVARCYKLCPCDTSSCSFICCGGATHPNQRLPRVLSTGVKLPGREANHSPPASAEVKNAWRHTSSHQYVYTCTYRTAVQWYRSRDQSSPPAARNTLLRQLLILRRHLNTRWLHFYVWQTFRLGPNEN